MWKGSWEMERLPLLVFGRFKHYLKLSSPRRTQTGVRLWIFLARLAYSLCQSRPLLAQAANHPLGGRLERLGNQLIRLMIDCECSSRRSTQQFKLVAVYEFKEYS